MEVFSRRSRNLPKTDEKNNLTPLVTPERLQSLFVSRLNEICARFEEWSYPFTVVGRLGTVPPDSWRRYEPLPLLDLQGQAEIGLEVTLSLLEEAGLKAGDVVQATGFLRARLVKGQVSPRFETVSLCRNENGSDAALQSEANILSLLRDLPAETHNFPHRDDLRLLLINLSLPPECLQDLKGALGALWHERSIRSLTIKSTDRQMLLQSLLTMTEDIVVILSGNEGLPMLENSFVLKAITACKAHRISVLENRRLEKKLDEKKPALRSVASHLMDRHFSSALEAGRYIREQSGQTWQAREEERARQEELNALRDSLARFADLPDVSRKFGVWRGIIIGVALGIILVVVCLLVMRLLGF
ncbi:RidA family protein [Aristophania vespae]|uniref:RidA family protein n=1 Tax=Aristophania vespae TaxID=2697033 RepID=UPI00235124E4|nr:hypothetical protein [Aristophania vespae]UMM64332.1 hypothetical protein DM15PD_13450 [Aristophania vespae]